MNNLNIQNIEITRMWEHKNNPKLHNWAQITKIRESIREFGFINPVLLDENLEIIAGHGRVAAARDMGMHDVPAIILSHLTDAQKRAYRIADNKLTELGKWSIELLNLEFTELSKLDLNFDLGITGFETSEIDLILDGAGTSDPKNDIIPPLNDADHRCRRGDIWRLGRHTIICGDADKIIASEHTSPRQFYRYLDLAYMNPETVNGILSGKQKINVNNLFQNAKAYQM